MKEILREVKVGWPVVVVVMVVKVGVDWEQNVEMSKCRDDSRW